MRSLNSVIALSKRELLITYRNFYDILSILLFFLLGVLIFVFAIGPKINAAGRMGHGHLAVDLLTTPNPKLLEELRLEIENHNLKRRATEKMVSLNAIKLAEETVSLPIYPSLSKSDLSRLSAAIISVTT